MHLEKIKPLYRNLRVFSSEMFFELFTIIKQILCILL